MEQELVELKKVFRALAVSTPLQVDVRSLLRDYRSMMGQAVPIQKWGYRDPLLFIKEQCSDCFLISGPTSNPLLTLIVTDSIKHIDKFVQKQKATPAMRFKGKRRSVPESLLTPKPSLIADTFKVIKEDRFEQIVTKLPEDEPTQKLSVNHDKENRNNNNIQVKVNKESVDNIKENGNCEAETLKKFYKKQTPRYTSEQTLSMDVTCGNKDSKKSGKEDNDSGRQTSSSSSSTKALRLEQLKNDIMDIISGDPNGVWCLDLIRIYRERHKRELTFAQFGYSSILSLICTMPVKVSKPKDVDDWLLYDPRLAPRLEPKPIVAHLATNHSPRKVQLVDPEDALPGIGYEAGVFPPDCVHYTESIPGLTVAGLSTGAMLEVILGEVYSPSHFWFIRLGDLYHLAMDDLMDQMTRYYTCGEGRGRALSRGAVRVGQYCASVYDNEYHRSLIVKIIDSDTVKVRHVDYGTVDMQPVHRLKPLLRQWAELPAQATRARLAALRPANGNRRWQHAASAHFLSLVLNKKLVACVLAADEEENVVEVTLVDTSTEEDVCIGSELVKAGYADTRPDSALRTSEIYLYPRFEALENGETPNFAEIYNYQKDGITLDYVEEYRRHVPACLPAGSPPPVLATTPDPVPEPSPDPVPDPDPCPDPNPEADLNPIPEVEPTPQSVAKPPLSIVNRIPLLSFSSSTLPASSTSPCSAERPTSPSNTSEEPENPHSSGNSTHQSGKINSPPPVPPSTPMSAPRLSQPCIRPKYPSGPCCPDGSYGPRAGPGTPFPANAWAPYQGPRGPPVMPRLPPHPLMSMYQYPQSPSPSRPAYPFANGLPPPMASCPYPSATPSPRASYSYPHPAAVNLSLTDCEIYRVLRATNPELAHKFMTEALDRAVAELRQRSSSQYTLNVFAPEFRCVSMPTGGPPAPGPLSSAPKGPPESCCFPPGFEK